MTKQCVNEAWLSADGEYSLPEISELSGFSQPEIRALVDFGGIAPLDPDAAQWWFSGLCLQVVCAARSLRTGFELDSKATALTVSLLLRIQFLEGALRSLRRHTPSGHDRNG
jgi:MerR-like DNA binding protein